MFYVHQCNVVSSCQWKCLDGVFTVMVRSTLGLKGTIHLKEDILKGKLVHCHFPPLTSTAWTKQFILSCFIFHGEKKVIHVWDIMR